MNISAIIMASGLSRRMGTNKLLLDFKGKKVYRYILDLVEGLDFDQVILVSSYEEILSDGRGRGFDVVFNKNNFIGKSESIRLGVNRAKKENALMFFVADQVLLSSQTTGDLLEAFEGNPVITYPKAGARRGSPVIFPPKYREGLLVLEKDQGGMILAEGEEKNEVQIEDERQLRDLDTYEDFLRLGD